MTVPQRVPSTTGLPTTQRLPILVVMVLLIFAVIGFAFATRADHTELQSTARQLNEPAAETDSAARRLAEPSRANTQGETSPAPDERLPPDALALIAEEAVPASPNAVDVPSDLRSRNPVEETRPVEETSVSPEEQTSAVGRDSAVTDRTDEESTVVETPEWVATQATITIDARTPGPTSTATPRTTTTTPPTTTRRTTTTTPPTTTRRTTTTTPPTTTATPSTTTPPQRASVAVNWVSPGATGHRNSLHSFPAANDGPHGVTINQAFLDQHQNAPWLSYENGRPIISRANADGLCLNITVTLTLRDSRVNCPTRTQNDSWGYAGRIDDAPAVNILAGNVVVEYNTITCSGRDGNICGRNVRVGAKDALIQYNDLSFARGAVEVFTGTVFRFNYAHDFSFGFDPSRASNPSDNITHNNPINNLGYSAQVHGNYIVARYGRVSAQPNTYRNPHFHNVYSGGVVEVGDPLNGFAFVNYLVNGPGNGYRVTDNYFVDVGRAFLCNNSDRHANSSCADDISRNVFADHHFDDFQGVFFRDEKGRGSINGSCNVEGSNSSSFNVLPSSAFGTGKNHNTNNC